MSRNKNNNLIKLKRKARLDSTVIDFAIILIYVAVVVIMSFMKEPIPTYKVGSSNINSNISCTGIALRNEIEITSGKSGYMIYFVHDGDKIKKNADEVLDYFAKEGITVKIISGDNATTVASIASKVGIENVKSIDF